MLFGLAWGSFLDQSHKPTHHFQGRHGSRLPIRARPFFRSYCFRPSIIGPISSQLKDSCLAPRSRSVLGGAATWNLAPGVLRLAAAPRTRASDSTHSMGFLCHGLPGCLSMIAGGIFKRLGSWSRVGGRGSFEGIHAAEGWFKNRDVVGFLMLCTYSCWE